MKIAVVGMGYWGPNLVRNFLATEGVSGVICCDVQKKRLEKVKQRFYGVETTTSYKEILRRSDIDAIALATPVSTHYPLGMQALEEGKHLLVEKPLTLRSSDAEELIEKAESSKLVLMVDHTFVYTGAVRKIKEYLVQGEIGDILYFDSVRVNLGLFQHDTNVIWDLAPHDISIMDFLIQKRPLSVIAVGARHFNGQEDMAYLVVHFPDNLIAHFHVNWISPVKVRKILIGGSKLMVVYDDMEPSEKIRLYNKGVEIKSKDSVYQTLVQYRTGDMFAPHIDQTEALSLMTSEFVNSIQEGRAPLSDGQSGLNVVRILEAAERSLRLSGQMVKLSGDGNGEHVRQLIRKLKSQPAAT
jgi:predicted dehydrogenase